MDEPFGALDAITKASLQDQLLELKVKIDATVVFITHDVEEAVYLADRVMVMSRGPGRLRALIDNPSVGSPPHDDAALARVGELRELLKDGAPA
jgi:NitT/TauT family transport system ATP-binding protein